MIQQKSNFFPFWQRDFEDDLTRSCREEILQWPKGNKNLKFPNNFRDKSIKTDNGEHFFGKMLLHQALKKQLQKPKISFGILQKLDNL